MQLILTVASIHLLACLSPGPDIFLVVLNSLRSGWRTGVYTTLGILTGVSLHITLGITGISYLITQSPATNKGIALAGGAWLMYLGGRGIAQWIRRPSQAESNQSTTDLPSGFRAAWIQGFLVNITNPKAFLFFLSIFSVLLGPNVSIVTKVTCGTTMIGVQAIAFSTVAFLIDQPRFKEQWTLTQQWLDRAISLIFFALGIWIWITTLISLGA